MTALPILVTCFARPDLLERSLSSLMEARIPVQFFFHIDGPRLDNPDDVVAIERCKGVIETFCGEKNPIIKCSSNNLGVREAMLSAISWFFDQVEFGLILEEDILLHPEALKIALDCLIKFKEDLTIGAISLHNNVPKRLIRHHYDLYLSNITFLWGWATWRNRWVATSGGIENPFQRLRYCKLYKKIGFMGFVYFLKFLNYKAKFSWDGDVLLNYWEHDYRTILFRENLAWNIGFDSRATHTKKQILQRPIYTATLESLTEMKCLMDTDRDFEKLIIKEVFGLKSLQLRFQYIKWFITNIRNFIHT